MVRAEPVIAPSARKHGVSDEDIRHAYANPIRVFEVDDGFARPREVLEVMMPRTLQDILDHGDELAKRFEDYEPTAEDERDPEVFAGLRRSVVARSEAERSIQQAVAEARSHGYSWRTIGSLIGTSGEAARQRYGVSVKA